MTRRKIILRSLQNRYLIKTIKTAIFFSLILFNSSAFAKCPIKILHVNVKSKNTINEKMYAEINDYFGPVKTELVKQDDEIYSANLEYLTIGFVLFIELSCSYNPTEIILYTDNNNRKTYKINSNDLQQNTDSTKEYDYEVNLDF